MVRGMLFKGTTIVAVAFGLLGGTPALAATAQETAVVRPVISPERMLPRDDVHELSDSLDSAWFNLRSWIHLQNRSDDSTPEGTLARVVTSLLTRDTGALPRPELETPSGPQVQWQFSLDLWLTDKGKMVKGKLAGFDVSSPWLYTLSVADVKGSADGNSQTYLLKGTSRTSAPGGIYPVAISVTLIKDGNGHWRADDFNVVEPFPKQRLATIDYQLSLPAGWTIEKVQREDAAAAIEENQQPTAGSSPAPTEVIFRKNDATLGGLRLLDFNDGMTARDLLPRDAETVTPLWSEGLREEFHWTTTRRKTVLGENRFTVHYERRFYFIDQERRHAYELYFDTSLVGAEEAWDAVRSFRTVGVMDS
ncbi:hypothetical protein GTO91_10120 [Heliobacterium undosum]|uniref:Uncharacterized protein n=1 Tax=Heliomicrobium undosum TaxID=121734 RepID=A0A845LAW0_9FIRM|nr:hypothetical protein [Heliomicrobium undosum]MZP30061.1 hypothetical protein [Heliomicrobium undosum]